MNLVRLQYGGGGGELHGASITVNTEESTLVGKEALLYKVSDLSTIINRTVFSALSSDGVSTATFNNIIEPDIYIVKSSNGTKEGNTDNIEITSDDVINKTTLVRSLSLTLELNVTFYSASGETIKYKRQNSDELILLGKADNTGKGNGTIICKDGETITFSGDIAKDTTGTTAYSKDITITSNTTEIYVMPDGAVYWYGNMCTELPLGGGEYINTNNGWSSTTFINPVPNTNYLDCNATSQSLIYCGIGTKNIIDISKYSICNVIAKGIKAGNNNHGNIMGLTSKAPNIDENRTVISLLNSTNITKISANLPASTNYASYTSANGRRSNLYAMWLE